MSHLDEILAERERWRKHDVRMARCDGFVAGVGTAVVVLTLVWLVVNFL